MLSHWSETFLQHCLIMRINWTFCLKKGKKKKLRTLIQEESWNIAWVFKRKGWFHSKYWQQVFSLELCDSYFYSPKLLKIIIVLYTSSTADMENDIFPKPWASSEWLLQINIPLLWREISVPGKKQCGGTNFGGLVSFKTVKVFFQNTEYLPSSLGLLFVVA